MSDIQTDVLIDNRELAREHRDWAKSDLIRDELDSRNCYVFDTKQGQEVWHCINWSRSELESKMRKDKQDEKYFEAWLYSTNKSFETKQNNDD